MKIKGKCTDVSILYAKETVGVKDPEKKYYHLGLWFKNENETGEIPCSPELYSVVAPVVKSHDLSVIFDFETEYNTQYKYFRLSSVLDQRKEKKG